MKFVSLIIPTYNESKNLPLLVEEIFSSLDKNQINVEIIFVDDNSPDGTGVVAEELAKKFPIKVIHRAKKLGLGSAVREGFALSTRPLLGVMDADLSHDPSILNSMIHSLSEHDICVASRFKSGSSVEKWLWWRKMLSEIGVLLTKGLTGTKDPLSGYFFLRQSVIDKVPLETQGYKILFEILVKGTYKKIKEFPYQFRMRKHSTSKLDWREHWLFLKQIIQYSIYRVKNR